MPFFDFGNVRFRGDADGNELPAAGTVVAHLGTRRSAPAPRKTPPLCVFVHPFADALRSMRVAGPQKGALMFLPTLSL